MTAPSQTPISFDDLERRLERHALWLDSRETDGRRFVLEDTTVRDVALEGRRLARALLSRVTMAGVGMAGVKLGGGAFHQVRFLNCDLTAADLGVDEMSGCAIIDSLCTRAEFTAGRIDELEMQGSDCTGALFVKAQVRKSRFAGIVFARANLLKAHFDGSHLQGCDFTDANLMKASFANSDLRGCCFAGANAEKLRLRDVRMAGAHGTPQDGASLFIENVDLSPEADGSRMLGPEMVDTLLAEMRTTRARA